MSTEQQRFNRTVEAKYNELIDEGLSQEDAMKQAEEFVEGVRDDYADMKMESARDERYEREENER